MAEPNTATYRRLPGRTAWFRFGGSSSPSCSLWLGPDHLLKIERSASRETYKRFLYRDIQSLFIEKSSRLRSLVSFNVIILLLLLTLYSVFDLFGLAGTTFLGVLALPFLIGLVMNGTLGTTCDAMLVTAVGSERLSSLCRLAPSARAVQQITTEVEKIQGAVGYSQLTLQWPAATAKSPST